MIELKSRRSILYLFAIRYLSWSLGVFAAVVDDDVDERKENKKMKQTKLKMFIFVVVAVVVLVRAALWWLL